MIVAIITARMKSTRLPGKALADICGKPILWHIVNRVKNSKYINKIIIATDQNSPEIIEFTSQNKIDCYAGADNDILDRLYQTAKQYKADIIVRVWGDSPLVNPQIIDELIEFFDGYDYAYNTKCPEGQNVAVVSFKILEKVWYEVKDPKQREWIHLYFINSDYKVGVMEAKNDLSAIKLSVDTAEDLEFIRGLYERDKIYHRK